MAEYSSNFVTEFEAGLLAHTLEVVYRQPLYYKVGTALATTDILFLTTIPSGLRVAGGKLVITAGGATVTAKISDYTYEKEIVGDEWTGNYVWTEGHDDRFGTLTDLTLATEQTFADTAAKGLGYPGILTNGKETRIALTFTDNGGGETVQADTEFSGYINFGK